MNKLYRQGDVLLVRTDCQIPSNKVATKRCTLALGEATGHHHTVEKGAVGFADDPDDLAEFVQVTDSAGAFLTHQEHDPIFLEFGTYEVVGQYQYEPERISRVAD